MATKTVYYVKHADGRTLSVDYYATSAAAQAVINERLAINAYKGHAQELAVASKTVTY